MNNNDINTENNSAGVISEILQWINAILLALLIALLIRGFIFEPVMVKGSSMENTLFDSQRLLVYKLGYYFSAPQRGDIIVFQYQPGVFSQNKYLDEIPFFRKAFPDFKEINYIKRVIGLPGDKIDIIDNKVYVNNEMIEDSHAKGETLPNNMQFPATVPANKVFVLGDNRQNSSDSRSIGFIDMNRIKGRAVFRIYPFSSFGTIK
ncbi:MAG: signal peptidase I [Clostridia bacterium]|nr:signal peptidase I [Clostridia bacterium]